VRNLEGGAHGQHVVLGKLTQSSSTPNRLTCVTTVTVSTFFSNHRTYHHPFVIAGAAVLRIGIARCIPCRPKRLNSTLLGVPRLLVNGVPLHLASLHIPSAGWELQALISLLDFCSSTFALTAALVGLFICFCLPTRTGMLFGSPWADVALCCMMLVTLRV